MTSAIEQFQAAAAQHNQGRPRYRWRYPKASRALALEYFELHRRARSAEEIADDLGIGATTLYRWRRELKERSEQADPKLRPVVVTEDAPNSRSADFGETLSIVTPTGLRIEGLSLEQTIELARVLR